MVLCHIAVAFGQGTEQEILRNTHPAVTPACMAIHGWLMSLATGAREAALLSNAAAMKEAAPSDTHSGKEGCICVMARIVPSRSACAAQRQLGGGASEAGERPA